MNKIIRFFSKIFGGKELSQEDKEYRDELKSLRKQAKREYTLAQAKKELEIATVEGEKAAQLKYKHEKFVPKKEKSLFDQFQDVAKQSKGLSDGLGNNDYTFGDMGQSGNNDVKQQKKKEKQADPFGLKWE